LISISLSLFPLSSSLLLLALTFPPFLHTLPLISPSLLLTQRGWTPLIAAASRDQKDVVKVLLQHGADVTALSIVVKFLFLSLIVA